MKTTTKAFDVEKLIKWLEKNKNGRETFFLDDVVLARNFAEEMRANVGACDAISIEQSSSKVTISLVGAACKTG